MIKANLKRYLQTVHHATLASSALLLLRLIMGIAFTYHGWGKIQNPFAWVPPQAPVSIPSFFQFLASLSEFGGGIALILGFLTPIASFGLVCTMSVAVYFHSIVMKDPFVNMTGGSSYEPALVYLGISILFLAFGPGKFSLDSKIFGGRK
ncbi:DoxX family protein [bacterium]|nr:DoxX family protein [bacterium]